MQNSVPAELSEEFKLWMPGSRRAREGDHNILDIGCRASCGAWKTLAELDSRPATFHAVPVWARAGLFEFFLRL